MQESKQKGNMAELTFEQSDPDQGEPVQVVKTPEGMGAMTASDAARMLAALRHKTAEAPTEQPATPAEGQESETPVVEDAAAVEQPSGETQEAEAETPIEPPRSWSKEEKERFESLPRETQEYLSERESQRDRAVSQAQREAAEQRKAIEAQREQMEKARANYESYLPQVQQLLHDSLISENFSDIKTISDLERLAKEDWARYLQWDVAQKKIASVQQQLQEANQRRQSEHLEKFVEFAKKEDAAFTERAPEAKDPKAFEKVQKGAVDLLKDVGFTDEELGQGWHGQRDFSLRDHRVQLLIRDAYLYRENQARQKEAAKKMASQKKQPSPVQRPGVVTGGNQALSSQIQELERRLPELRGNAAIEAAVQIAALRRSA